MCELLRLLPLNGTNKRKGVYKCSCGNEFTARVDHVKSGSTSSCGCYRHNKAIKHGYSIHGRVRPEYNVWASMINRCTNSSHRNYSNYGGRGIKVSNEWLTFQNFINDMGDRPSDNHSIDRIDVNGNYCKENCRWATKEQQSYNRTDNNYVMYKGSKKCISELAKEFNMTFKQLSSRINRGWDLDRSLTTPIKTNNDVQTT